MTIKPIEKISGCGGGNVGTIVYEKDAPITPEFINSLISHAKDGKLTEKIYIICEEFGDKRSKTHGTDMTLKEGSLSLYADSFAANCNASWNGEEVYLCHLGGIIAYRPSVPDWVEALNILAEKATTKRNAVVRREQEQEQKELRKRWG